MERSWKKQFFTIYLGQAFSIIGSATVQFAIVWYLTSQTQSAITLTTATIVGFIPGALFGAFAGVFVDRHNRKRVMIVADGFVALSSVFLGLAFWHYNTPPIWFIYLILFMRGIGSTFHMPAMQAAIPTLVPQEELTKAGGWASFVSSGSNILAPMLGAFLMGIAPIHWVVLVDILGALFAIVCLLFVKIPDIRNSEEQENASFKSELKQGFIAIKGNKPLMTALPHYVFVGILYFPLSSLFPLLVLTHYQGTEMHIGLVNTACALGVLLTSLALSMFGNINRKLRIFSMSILLVGGSAWIIGLLSPTLFFVCLVFAFTIGVAGSLFNVPFYAYVQESIAHENMGRVMSLLLTICTIANPIGLLLAGSFSEVVGVNNWFVATGVLFVINGLLCLVRINKAEREYLKSIKVN